jgi:type II pantothenate kinase
MINSISINLSENLTSNKVINQTIGVDSGHSLSKIALIKDSKLEGYLFNSRDFIDYLNSVLKNKGYQNLNFTGGNGFKLNQYYSNEFNTKLLDEFESTGKGITMLYELEKKEKLGSCLIVTIGTGTSIILKNESIEHIGGSALGGAFFLGILNLLFSHIEYNEAIKLARGGNRDNIDLKVLDIYEKDDNRVPSTFKMFTAASLGKLIDHSVLNRIKKEDLINSVINLIAENVGNYAISNAKAYVVNKIVFAGGFLINNSQLKQTLTIMCKFNNLTPVFLKNSEYAGALGALYY